LNARQKIRIVVAKEGGFEPPEPPLPGGGSGGFGDGSLKRDIPKNHDFDPKALKPMARTLFSASVALGHSVAAYKAFARIKSSSISPDGMLGGRGYVLKVREVRAKLQQACELLSAITDTIHDEIHAPHWAPRLADLGMNDAEDVTEFMDEADQVLEDPESFGEKEVEEIEKKNDGPGGTPNTKQKDKASELPTGGAKEIGTEAAPVGEAAKKNTKTASWGVDANSSLPVNTLPGPRVDHLERGEQTGPYGSYNKDEPLTQDAWGEGQGVGDWSKVDKVTWGQTTLGESAMPDSNTDTTKTDARDFGIGYGANGGGSEGYGTKAPDGKGVWGPSSGLPDDPKAPTRDREEGSGPYLDGVERNVWACEPQAESKLPFDGPDPVARSDYYDGNKGNQFNVSPVAESRMPGDQAPALYNYDRDLMDVGQDYERQDVPYIKYDWTTHNYRNDVQDVFRHEDEHRGSNG